MAMVVGSVALKELFPWFPRRPQDLDLICTLEEKDQIIKQLNPKKVISRRPGKTILKLHNKTMVELDSDPSSLAFLEANLHTKPVENLPGGLKIPPAMSLILFLIKKSHIDYAINWKKNIHDYQWMLTNRETLFPLDAANLPEPAYDLSQVMWDAYKLRRKEIASRRSKPKVNLLEPNEKFFTQYSIHRDFDHDDVHQAVMYYDEPMYRKLKDDQALAWCDWEKFQTLSHTDKIRTVREEAYVIALERHVFPGITRGIEPRGKKAFMLAMEAICTRLWAGKWAWFAINHFWEIADFDVDYVSKAKPLIERIKVKND